MDKIHEAIKNLKDKAIILTAKLNISEKERDALLSPGTTIASMNDIIAQLLKKLSVAALITSKELPAISIDPRDVIIREGFKRAREDLGDIDSLAESILLKGQISPILITNDFELIAGERRLRACQSIPIAINAIFRDQVDDITLRELELEENIQRKDMEWQEKLTLTKEINDLKQKKYGEKRAGKNQKGWSAKDTAKLMGKSSSAVVKDIHLAESMEAIPELKKAKTADDARKLLRKMEEELLLTELVKRQKAKNTNHNYAFAHTNYIIDNALTALKELPDEFRHYADVDTPYGIDLAEVKKSKTETKELKAIGTYQEWSRETFLDTSKFVAEQVYRILSKDAWCTWWFGIEYYAPLKAMLEEVGFVIDPVPAMWFAGKKAAQTNQPQIMFAKSYDTFFLCRKGKPVLAKPGKINVFECPKVDADKKIHPTEKPFELYQEVINTIVFPGSQCIVPFLGSGNALRAIYANKSKGFGYDLDENIKNRFLLRVEADIENKVYGG